jgi:HlyD family secretion protein
MKSRNLIFLLLGVVAVLGAGIWWSSSSKPKGEKVQTEKIARRTIYETVSASGKIFPEVEVKISSDVSGEIVELLVQEGDTVKKGQLLCRVNPEAYISTVERGEAGVNSARAQADQSRSQIESTRSRSVQAKAQLENAKTVFERQKTLFADGVISKAELDNASVALSVAEATFTATNADIKSIEQGSRAADYSIKSADAQLKELRTNLKRTSIYAPTSGIISKLNVKKGERVLGTIQMSGTEILRIADFSSMEVQVDVSENDVPRVNVGDNVDIDIDAFIDKKFKGKVYQIANTANNTTTATGAINLNSDQVTNFIVKIRIDPSSYADLITKGKKHPFRPGMSASVEIFTKSIENTLSVSIQGVTTRDREEAKKVDEDDAFKAKRVEKEASTKSKNIKEVVFVCSGDTLKMVEVKTGIQDDTFIEIEGLQEGEEIVIGPYEAVSRKLKPGDRFVREDLTKKENKKSDK